MKITSLYNSCQSLGTRPTCGTCQPVPSNGGAKVQNRHSISVPRDKGGHHQSAKSSRRVYRACAGLVCHKKKTKEKKKIRKKKGKNSQGAVVRLLGDA